MFQKRDGKRGRTQPGVDVEVVVVFGFGEAEGCRLEMSGGKNRVFWEARRKGSRKNETRFCVSENEVGPRREWP